MKSFVAMVFTIAACIIMLCTVITQSEFLFTQERYPNLWIMIASFVIALLATFYSLINRNMQIMGLAVCMTYTSVLICYVMFTQNTQAATVATIVIIVVNATTAIFTAKFISMLIVASSSTLATMLVDQIALELPLSGVHIVVVLVVLLCVHIINRTPHGKGKQTRKGH